MEVFLRGPGFHLGTIQHFLIKADYVQFPEPISKIGKKDGMPQLFQILAGEFFSCFPQIRFFQNSVNLREWNRFWDVGVQVFH